MPIEEHICSRFFQIKEETIKIQNEMIQLRLNPFIIEHHNFFFFYWYKYKLKLLRNELFELQNTKCHFL